MPRRPRPRRTPIAPPAAPPPAPRFHIRCFRSTIALIKRNPIKFATSALLLFGSIPAGIAGLNYIDAEAEPLYLAQHYWVRGAQAPFIKTQADHDYAINYLILKDQRQALKDAKDELAKHPDSATAPATIERLEKSIEQRAKRLDDNLLEKKDK